MALKIEITSDFICPWCLVAETRLTRAIAKLDPITEIQRIWHPYELNPDMPTMGMERRTYRSSKFGSWEYSQQLDAKTIQATQNDGIGFRYDLMAVTPNTLKAHRLTGFAARYDKATAIAERILKAYFTEGQSIAEVDILANLADEIGLAKDSVKTFLQSDAGTQEVRELEYQAVVQGIRGVPSIRIGQQVLSGAQSVEAYLTVLCKLTEVAQ